MRINVRKKSADLLGPKSTCIECSIQFKCRESFSKSQPNSASCCNMHDLNGRYDAQLQDPDSTSGKRNREWTTCRPVPVILLMKRKQL